ncbi:hypothetical protein ACMD2_07605 [Ananas comosus]|uniref:3'-5' exonuclease domain-containing protein n=1 Tax=Ananas comosus TaxID=4615 RepID=A0A199W9K0_ANACO|nr:hypothetical protein ACMD2_07605 [Ananas comosus]
MAITLRSHQDGSFTVGFALHSVHTTITSFSADAFRWLVNLYCRHPRFSGLVVGLAIEQRPVRPPHRPAHVAVLQLWRRPAMLIFQVVLADRILLLVSLLNCRTCRFVSMDAAAVANRLRNEYGLAVRNAVDLGELAAERMGRADLRRANVWLLAREVAGIEANTGAVTSRWDQPDLSMNQIVKASADAFLALEVGRRLLHEKREREREVLKMAITLRHHGNGSYTVGFAAAHFVHATVTSSGDEAFKWVRNLHSRHPGISGIVIGLAIEQRPSADQRKIAVLQLSVDHQCLIFQIARADWTPSLLRRLLDSHTCRFVSVDAAAVADRLRNEHGLVVRNMVDLGELAAERTGLADLRRANVLVLAREVVG